MLQEAADDAPESLENGRYGESSQAVVRNA